MEEYIRSNETDGNNAGREPKRYCVSHVKGKKRVFSFKGIVSNPVKSIYPKCSNLSSYQLLRNLMAEGNKKTSAVWYYFMESSTNRALHQPLTRTLTRTPTLRLHTHCSGDTQYDALWHGFNIER